MAKKKTRKRKNPKRVAAGRKAARTRYGKSSRKVSKKRGKKTKRSSGLEAAITKVLSKHFTVAVDGSRHTVAFPGQHKATKRRSNRKASPAQLAARARFALMAKARAASRRSGNTMFGPVYNPKLAGGGRAAIIRAKRLASLAKARIVKAAKARKFPMYGAGLMGWK